MAENEVVIGGGKTIKVGGADWPIFDRGIPGIGPSLVTEARMVGGSVLYISLAETVVDGDNPPEAHVCARLRMDLGFAQNLRDMLDAVIKNALKPADKTQAN